MRSISAHLTFNVKLRVRLGDDEHAAAPSRKTSVGQRGRTDIATAPLCPFLPCYSALLPRRGRSTGLTPCRLQVEFATTLFPQKLTPTFKGGDHNGAYRTFAPAQGGCGTLSAAQLRRVAPRFIRSRINKRPLPFPCIDQESCAPPSTTPSLQH